MIHEIRYRGLICVILLCIYCVMYIQINWCSKKDLWNFVLFICLTHWGLATSYGDKNICKHWPMLWLGAWWHQAITYTNADLVTVANSPDQFLPEANHFYPRPVWALGYCRCLRVSVCLCVRQSWACPSDISSTVQARITKFGPEKQNTLIKIPIVFWGNWAWPSRSNLTSNSKLTPFWACPNHY